MLEKPAELLQVLKEAINVEKDGYHFYQVAAARTKDGKGKSVFRSLALDELEHKGVLEGLHQAIKSKTKFRFTPSIYPCINSAKIISFPFTFIFVIIQIIWIIFLRRFKI